MERSTERDLPGRVGFVFQALVQASAQVRYVRSFAETSRWSSMSRLQ